MASFLPNCFTQETYEIFGQMKMGPGGACPSGLHGKKAKVKCAEGEIFELPADAMALSLRARKDLLENAQNGCDEELDYPKLGDPMLRVSLMFQVPRWRL